MSHYHVLTQNAWINELKGRNIMKTNENKYEFKYINPYLCTHHPVYMSKANKYAENMKKGDKFPPVKAHLNLRNGRFEVRNGAHRTMAAKLCGRLLFVKVAKLETRQLRLL